MARGDMSAVQAFELLKRLSQETNTKLVDVARQLTAEISTVSCRVDRCHRRFQQAWPGEHRESMP